MNLIDLIVEPSVLCPKDKKIVLLSDCNLCEHFYGYTSDGQKVGCEYDIKGESGAE